MPVLTLYSEWFWVYWAALFSFGCGIFAGGILADLIFNMYFRIDEAQSEDYSEAEYQKDCRNRLLLILFIVGIIVVLLMLAMIVNRGNAG
jgi:uncharacterized membrane protein